LTVAYQDIHKELIELSKAGNSKAQYQLYQLYAKAMFNICMRMMNKVEEAEDMLQEGFTEAFTKLDSFRYESSFGAWLKRIVINRCINTIKKKKAELVPMEDMGHFDAGSEDSTEHEDLELNVKKVHRAIEMLPEGYRVIFSLYLLEGYDHGEIAQIMGISESTSKSQYMRAKLKIKEILKTGVS
jgi:RNA polymerase sigma factor (sigma-70 family)